MFRRSLLRQFTPRVLQKVPPAPLPSRWQPLLARRIMSTEGTHGPETNSTEPGPSEPRTPEPEPLKKEPEKKTEEDNGSGAPPPPKFTNAELEFIREKFDKAVKDYKTSPPLPSVAAELESREKELEKKTQEAKDFKDKFARAVADFRNLQDRTEREKKSARDFAIQKFAKDLVDSVDNLDRAMSAVPEASRNDAEKNKDLVDLYNGLKLTESILLSTLKKHGLEKIDPVGETFDPNRHEATFQMQMQDKTPGTVFNVQQTGFVLNGRTIRAAKVGIVANPQ